MRFLSALLLFAALATPLGAIAQRHKTKSSIPPATAKMLSADLFVAITDHNYTAASEALKSGADPNGRNWLGFTPLIQASWAGQSEIARLLLKQGARINDLTNYGSALTIAAISRHDKLGTFLLANGATANPPRDDKTTPLMAAAANGCLGILRQLLERHADPNQKASDSGSALIYAARRNQLEAARLLIESGAQVDIADKMQRTPLHYAALAGSAPLVRLLLAKGASVKAVDATGATPLHLVARYSGDAETIQGLLQAGAPALLLDGHGNSAYSLADRRGYEAATEILRPVSEGALKSVSFSEPMTTARAIPAALGAIEYSMKTFSNRAACVSCHHQGLGVMVLGNAAQRKIPVDTKLLRAYMLQLSEDGKRGAGMVHAAVLEPRRSRLIPAVDLGEFCYGSAYFLGALHANGVPPNPGLAEAARVVGALQKPDGAWRLGGTRGTMQQSNVTTTAMVLQALNVYWPADRKKELDRRIATAHTWLSEVKPEDAEGMASRLMGLKAAGADTKEVAAASQILLDAQASDGGWKVHGAPRSDAYTTGLSLYALRTAASTPSESPSIKRAVEFLLRTQDEDGSWYVSKVTGAYNNHFDGGFPHGYSQYASFAGTCWALRGLLETLDADNTHQQSAQ